MAPRVFCWDFDNYSRLITTYFVLDVFELFLSFVILLIYSGIIDDGSQDQCVRRLIAWKFHATSIRNLLFVGHSSVSPFIHSEHFTL